ncbi:MAG: hypothetical protein JRJ23_02045 [Deltaproteobacteria bacterium]|nr:hypothetical protein [Deltaproteobacteria bacterium]
MRTRFIADTMLGKLAKWLRVMGFDCHCQSAYREGDIDSLVRQGSIFLSRHKTLTKDYPGSMFIKSNDIGGQLNEVREAGYLISNLSEYFSRCLICNTPLHETSPAEAENKIPEYIFHQNRTGISFCPSCNRYFWPGSHRERMLKKLEEWGIGS